MTKNQFTIQPGNALPLGVTKVADGVQFAIYLPDKRECYLKLFRKGHQTEQYRIPLTDEYRIDRKSTRLNSSHNREPRMPSSA